MGGRGKGAVEQGEGEVGERAAASVGVVGGSGAGGVDDDSPGTVVAEAVVGGGTSLLH